MSVKPGVSFFKHPWDIFTANANAGIPDFQPDLLWFLLHLNRKLTSRGIFDRI